MVQNPLRVQVRRIKREKGELPEWHPMVRVSELCIPSHPLWERRGSSAVVKTGLELAWFFDEVKELLES